MTSHEHLEELLELRRGLLREVGRLDRVITSEITRVQASMPARASAMSRHDALSWEEALHEAKIPLAHEAFLPG
jgi:hypothetical protein